MRCNAAAIKADPDTSPPRNAAGPNTRVKLPTGITPWNVFCQRNRDSVRASRPELDPQEITGQLSHMWKSVGRDDRKICSEIAEVNRQGCSFAVLNACKGCAQPGLHVCLWAHHQPTP